MKADRNTSLAYRFPPGKLHVILKAAYTALHENLGSGKSIRTLLLSFIAGPFIYPSKWDPAKLPALDHSEVYIYERIHRDVRWLIRLNQYLREEYGEDIAQYLIAKIGFALVVPNFSKTFKSIGNFNHLDGLRSSFSTYLDSKSGTRWQEVSATDKAVVQYRSSRCATVEVLRVYGLYAAAAAVCLSDHVLFECHIPQLSFERTSCMGVGDPCCEIKLSFKDPSVKSWEATGYPDAEKADFNALKMIRYWKKKINSP